MAFTTIATTLVVLLCSPILGLVLWNYLVPVIFHTLSATIGTTIGYYLVKKTEGRRERILRVTQELESSHKAFTANATQITDSSSSSSDNEWDKVEVRPSATRVATGSFETKSPSWDGIVGFFHPFCNAGGGGERVLWAAIRATQKRWPRAKIVVYTGDHEVTKDQILNRVKNTFSIDIYPPTIHFLYLSTRHWVLASTWPHATLLGQSIGSVILGWDAFSLVVPDIFVDTMGYAFVLGLSKLLFPTMPTGAYVHYPTISTDMLDSLDPKSAVGGQGVNAGKGTGLKGTIKRLYWKWFAGVYSWMGASVDVVMTNSSWTQAHIQKLWGPRRALRQRQNPIDIVYPPCAVHEIEEAVELSDASEKARTKSLVYIAQFRPEKNHQLIIQAFHEFVKSDTPSSKDAKLVLLGSVRGDSDAKRVYQLRLLVNELHLRERVEFHLDAPWSDILGHLRRGYVGINGMWNEHFGIGVVEYLAAGLISVVHDSGGPKLDIVVDVDGQPTGFHATTSSEYAAGFDKALSLKNPLSVRQRARKSAQRFSEDEFARKWIAQLDKLVVRAQAAHVPAGLLLAATACIADSLPPLPLLENSPEPVLDPRLHGGLLGVGSSQQQPLSQPQQDVSLSGKKGAVACESKICSEIGIDLLAAGGNAVDAWVGTQLCVGVIGMHHSGLGGGGFAVIRDSNGGHHVIDYREAAPAAAHENMYAGNVNGSIWGGLAAAVPGELRGLEAAHFKFGKLPWRQVVEPAARVARDGYPVTEDLVRYMAAGVQYAGYNFLVEDDSWAQDFAPRGKVLVFGETMTRKRYADTLLEVAEKGADVFYKGKIAEEMIDIIQASNGSMTLQDLTEYRALFREPLEITYKDDYSLYTSGVPSSGAVLLNTLKIIEGYDDDVDANTTIHRFNEAMRFAYGAHQVLGDPAYLHDVNAFEASMLSKSTAASIRSRILDNATQPVAHYLPPSADGEHYYAAESHGTSHVVTADVSGMAVSSTTTVNLLFGNLQMTPNSGIILNNEMNDFSIPGRRNEFGYAPAPSNYIRPGKRPLSSITPVIVEDKVTGALIATVGAAGGSRIISSTTQVVWHLLGSGYSHESSGQQHQSSQQGRNDKTKEPKKMTMLEAIREPRLHDQLMPDYTMFEWAFDNATVADLASRGHNVLWVREGLSAVQGIRILRGDEAKGGKDSIRGFEAVGETRQKNSAGLSL